MVRVIANPGSGHNYWRLYDDTGECWVTILTPGIPLHSSTHGGYKREELQVLADRANSGELKFKPYDPTPNPGRFGPRVLWTGVLRSLEHRGYDKFTIKSSEGSLICLVGDDPEPHGIDTEVCRYAAHGALCVATFRPEPNMMVLD